MINREKEELENRQRVSDGVVTATQGLGLPPREQELIRRVTMGELPLVIVDERVVAALVKATILAPSSLIGGDLENPGWRQVETRRELSISPFSKLAAAELPYRVTGYYVRVPGQNYTEDLGGYLSLDVAREEGGYGRNYRQWELRWTPRGTPYTRTIFPGYSRPTTLRPPRKAKSKIVEPAPVPAPIPETPPAEPKRDILNTRTGERGTLCRNENGEPIEDAEGRLRVAFPGGVTKAIPKSLIGKVYEIETST